MELLEKFVVYAIVVIVMFLAPFAFVAGVAMLSPEATYSAMIHNAGFWIISGMIWVTGIMYFGIMDPYEQ